MRTIALIAQKGGTGKTTLGVSLAVAAEKGGKVALIVDLDPQSTACNWSDRRTADTPIVIDVQPGRLANALEKAREGGVDLAIIDTPARSEQASLAAAKAADIVLVPCRPQMYDLETIPNTQELLSLAGRPKAVAVLNAVPARGHRQEQAAAAIQRRGIDVCPHTLGHRAAFGDAAALGLSAQEYEPNGKAALELHNVYKYVSRLLAKPKTRDAYDQEARPVGRVG
jgi:chromosome partitioning protein